MNLQTALNSSLIIYDGAYGTSLQALGLSEADYRDKAFAAHASPLQGNHEVLNLTQPEAVAGVHRRYVEAGARILTTNTFNANAISQADYNLSAEAPQMAAAAVRIAKEVAEAAPEPVWVAGSVGPTNKTLSMGADVENPHLRSVTFEEVYQAYYDQIEAMVGAGVDIIMIETIFDTLNAKAALAAYTDFFQDKSRLPLWISATITDRSGRTLSGQTLEAFVLSVLHAQPTILGLNCALGADLLFPYVRELSALAPCAVAVHPNAGLPNELGGYDQSAETFAQILAQMADEGIVNLIGGCCGTSPEHIAGLSKAASGKAPRLLPTANALAGSLTLSGLEPLRISGPDAPFVFVGERTNVSGSPKFAKLVRSGDMAGAVEIARTQVDSGASLIDICFDDALLDGPALMGEFLRRIAAEPDISRVPLMIDSSDAAVLEVGLKSAQGKCVVNSLSLKDGADAFLAKAAMVRKYGAAAIVMAFDEDGQATDVDRRVAICQRAYTLLTAAGWTPDDIIFDLNILTIGTGIAEHATYAADFIAAISQVKAACPGARISGGLSNLSFAFRGQNAIREALHAVFLYHATRAGLDMAIVAAGMLTPYDSVEPQLRTLCEDLIFNKSPDATEALLAYAQAHAGDTQAKANDSAKNAWRELPLAQRMAHALLNGIDSHVPEDAAEALAAYPTALEIIEGPLMDGMRQVGDLFGEGKMFLPQVVKSARVMKAFVAVLQPVLEAQKSQNQTQAKKILLATVKGDVHDIGKNIVGVVLDCNGYEVIDLGVMVPCERILEAIEMHKPDLIGLSGLITPSLTEMIANAKAFQAAGCTVPLLIGGATTSSLHTALKIDPEYAPGVVYVPDASRVVEVCQQLLGKDAAVFIAQTKAKYATLRDSYANKDVAPLVSLSHARANPPAIEPAPRLPQTLGRQTFDFSIGHLRQYIDWSPFFWAWGLKGVYPKILDQNDQAPKLYADAQAMLERMISEGKIVVKGVSEFWKARRIGDDVEVSLPDGGVRCFNFLRQQSSSNGAFASMADFVSEGEGDSLGGFVVSVPSVLDNFADAFKQANDDYNFILVKAIGDRLVEAAAEYLHILARENYGQSAQLPLDDLIAERYDGIRPAFGYPGVPDHTQKQTLWELLDATAHTGATLTENFAMAPASTVSGLYFHHAQSRYFKIGKIDADQLADYSQRRGWSPDEAKKWLAPNL